MNTPVFSVIVPIYKVEKYLDKCIQSIIDQTYSNIEIILVDDGSPDNCPEICDKYAKKDKRIKVIHKENGGLSDARNEGLKIVSGKYVMFVDSDDYIDNDTCERFVSFTDGDFDIVSGSGISVGAYKKLTQKPEIGISYSGMEYLKKALKSGSMPMASWLYIFKYEFLIKNNLFFKCGITHEDEQFTPRAFLVAERVVNSGVCFYNYVIRDGSLTTNKDLRKNIKDLYETCKELENIYSCLEDEELKKLLKDSLVMKYLSLYQDGQAYKYGNEYIHKKFVMRNAHFMKTRFKGMLFCFNPKLYWTINNFKRRFKL